MARKSRQWVFHKAKENASISGHRDNEVPTGLSVADIKDLKAKGIKYDLSDNFDSEVPHPFGIQTWVCLIRKQHYVFWCKFTFKLIKVKIIVNTLLTQCQTIMKVFILKQHTYFWWVRRSWYCSKVKCHKN
jgi:hypothetical protein